MKNKSFIYRLLLGLGLVLVMFATAPELSFNSTNDVATITQDVPEVLVAQVGGEEATAEEDMPIMEPVEISQSEGENEPELSTIAKIWEWLKLNFWTLIIPILGLMEVIVRLTPTEKDNAWFNWLRGIFDSLIPNRSKSGGTHPSP